MILPRQETDYLLATVALKIRQSRTLPEILQVTVQEVRQLLESDRVFIYQFKSRGKSLVAVESLNNQKWSILGMSLHKCQFIANFLPSYRQGQVITNIDESSCHCCQQLQVKANLIVPIILPATPISKSYLWGLLVVNECSKPRKWRMAEINYLQQLTHHVASTIQQAELLAKTQKRWQAELKLRRSEERLQLALESSGDGLWDWNIVTGEVYLSPQWWQILGYEPYELPASYQTWENLIHPEDKPWVMNILNSHLQDSSIPYAFDHRLRTKSGEWKWIANYGKIVTRDHQGKPIRMVGIHKDISSRKQVEAELLHKSAELAEFSYNLKQLHRLNTTNYNSLKPLFSDYLKTGCSIFQCSTGIISRVQAQTYTIYAVQSDIKSLSINQQFELGNTFCAEVVTKKKTIAYNSIGAHYQLSAHPVYHNLQLESYLSTPILVNETVYGTLNFSSTRIRNRDFSIHEQEIIELMAKSIGKFIEAYQIEIQRQQAEIELRKAKEELEIRVSRRTTQLREANQLLQLELQEREQAQAALQESETRFQTMADCFPLLMWIANEQGKCTFFNKSWLNYTGRTMEEELGYGWTREVHPSDVTNRLSVYQEAFESRQSFQIEYRLQRWDGECRWLLDYGTPRFRQDGSFAGYIGSCIDISDRKKIEATLRESERRWRTLLENVRLLVVALDLQGNIDYVNPFFLEITEYNREEVIHKNWINQFIQSHHRLEVEKFFHQIIQPHASSQNHQKIVVAKSGEPKVIAWNSTQLRNLQGEPIGLMCIGEDITERHAIEKMKNEFISVVSHELRTPLTAVRGALRLLAKGAVAPESVQGKRVVQIAVESTERLVRLVNDILELERLESGKIELVKQKVNAKELLRQSIEQVQILANKAHVHLELQKADVVFYGDGDRLIQVLTNLLTNAIKFSQPDSHVCLCARSQSTANSGEKPHIIFIVQDQGRGIPAEQLESIFERFHQVDASDSRKKGGTGLGLAICRNIVEQHGGKIWVESMVGKGSIFYFTIPLA